MLLEILHELFRLLLVQPAHVSNDSVCQVLASRIFQPLNGAVPSGSLKVAMVELFRGYASSFEPSARQEVEDWRHSFRIAHHRLSQVQHACARYEHAHFF